MTLLQTEARLQSYATENVGHQISILIADDDPNLLPTYEMLLKSKNYKVFTTRDSSEVVNSFIMFRPNVVILDYQMPVKDGLNVASEILELDPKAKIIMLTAHDNIRKETERVGIDLFLTKPVSFQVLLDSIRVLTSLRSPPAIADRNPRATV